MESLLKKLHEITYHPDIIFRAFMENGELRRIGFSTGGNTYSFASLRLAKIYMHRNYQKTFYWLKDADNLARLMSQKHTKYTIWAFHVGLEKSDIPWFPPTLVYTHEPK